MCSARSVRRWQAVEVRPRSRHETPQGLAVEPEASEAEISEIDSLSEASEPGVWARPAH